MILPLLLTLAVQTHGRKDWIDPFSITDDNALVHQDCTQLQPSFAGDTGVLLAHYQRTLRLLLNTMTYDPGSLQYTAKLTPSISVADYDFLNEFSTLIRDDVDGWKKLDGVLSKVFHRSFSDKMYESLDGWLELAGMYLQSVETLACLAFLVFGLFVYRTCSLAWLLRRLLFLIMVAGYCLTWVELVQEKEIEKLVKARSEVPKECDPKGMSMYEYLFYSLGYNKDACTEYYKQTSIKSIWLVNPVAVLGHMLGTLVKTPAGAFGEAFGYFSSSILKSMPFYMWPLLPIVLILALMMTCILLSVCTNTRLKFNFLHIVQLDFGDNKAQDFLDYLPTIRYLRGETESLEQKKNDDGNTQGEGRQCVVRSGRRKRDQRKGNSSREKSDYGERSKR